MTYSAVRRYNLAVILEKAKEKQKKGKTENSVRWEWDHSGGIGTIFRKA
jgi:hypothetical protein